MARLIQNILSEGEFWNKWAESRLLKKNQNILQVKTGSTGSGKSLSDHRQAELWYRYFFKERYPVEKNTCFSIYEIMKRLSSGELREGDILILEEAGVNSGSGDWQSKAVKMFNYILQSFRSMNICLMMNLPALTMLSKQARQLVHIHMVTCGIDSEKGLCKVKPLFHQLNQSTGDSYWKFPRVKMNGKVIALKRLNYNLPSEDIRQAYEKKKAKFVLDLTQDFTRELEEVDKTNRYKSARKNLSDKQLEVYNLLQEGHNQTQIAKMLGKRDSTISAMCQLIEKRGYSLKNPTKSMEKSIFKTKNEQELPI